MNDKRNYSEKTIASLLKGEPPTTNLENDIMHKIETLAKKQNAKRDKEKMIIIIYISATITTLLIILLIFAHRNDHLPSHSFSPEDLRMYYTLFIVTIILAFMSFGTYFFRLYSKSYSE